MSTRSEAVRALWRGRPRSRWLRWSLCALAVLALWSWTAGGIDPSELWQGARAARLRRFLGEDLLPHALREQGFGWRPLRAWLGPLLAERGWSATGTTLAMSSAAIVLAAGAGLLALPFATRTLATAEPYLPEASAPGQALAWKALCSTARVLLVLLRAIPEYVWAYLLLAVFGPSAWPAVLALAIHNAGILGRLGAEAIENLEPVPLRAWRGLGADRRQLLWLAVPPMAVGRFLLYFFYRFETCVREATVLGMLGVVSLGYWIQDARSRQHYDDMLIYVLLGMLLVLFADLLSHLVRGYLRETEG